MPERRKRDDLDEFGNVCKIGRPIGDEWERVSAFIGENRYERDPDPPFGCNGDPSEAEVPLGH